MILVMDGEIVTDLYDVRDEVSRGKNRNQTDERRQCSEFTITIFGYHAHHGEHGCKLKDIPKEIEKCIPDERRAGVSS